MAPDLEKSEVLILGGGIAGLTAALALGSLRIPVALVEKSPVLGGAVRRFCCKATTACQQCGACLLNDKLLALEKEPRVTVHLETTLTRLNQEENKFLYTYKGPEGEGEGQARAILIATGFTPFRAEDKPQYGYGRHPNVLTGLDLEESLRDSGKVLRPSDQKSPQSVAFIQCVGSRDLTLGRPYCSQVCCGYALRMAKLLVHQDPKIGISFFYMDIQSFDKDFPLFMADLPPQVKLMRGIPGEIRKGENDQAVLIFQGEGDGPAGRQAFDLAILSVGIMPGLDNPQLRDRFNLTLNPDGFLQSQSEGIFLAGTVKGPKSIARSITQASRAAEEIFSYLQAGS
jgi:heterodisulfide reductase subunit A